MNPFVFDRPVDPDDLIDRQREATALLERAVGGHSSRLSSPRRFGKTTLLRRVLRDTAREGLGAVYVDFYGVTTLGRVVTKLERAYDQQLKGRLARMLADLRRSARARARAAAGPLGAEIELAPPAEQERAFLDALELPDRLFEKSGVRVVVAFDEFQAVMDVGEQVDALMRSVIQHQLESASYVFAGSHPGLMAALFGDRERPFFGQAAPVELEPLADEDLAEHIGVRFERTRREPGRALEWLLELAQGHPQRAMLLAHVLWSRTPAGATADEEAWAATVQEVGRWVREDFQGSWDRRSAVERRVLSALAEGGDGLYSRRVLERYGLTRGGAQSAVRRLVAAGELVHDPRRPANVRFVDPLLERWVAAGARWPDEPS